MPKPIMLVRPDALILDLRRDVPPGIGARERVVRLRSRLVRFRRPKIGPAGEGLLTSACSLENDVAELQGSVDVEVRSQAVGAGRGAQRGLRRFKCRSRIRGVALEGEALDLDPRQLERSEISLLTRRR